MSGGEKASPDVNSEFDPSAPLDPSRALVPHVMRLNERRVARGFLPKLRRVAARVPFASEALAVWYCARDDETPMTAKGMMFAALAYFVLPTDAVPDFIAGIGYTDDAAVF
ncbi:MAG TPA: YkvA family protein, partial [Phenylobacterium sp.]|nr:YkvA family protein [Phenylobacterium sp.]